MEMTFLILTCKYTNNVPKGWVEMVAVLSHVIANIQMIYQITDLLTFHKMVIKLLRTKWVQVAENLRFVFFFLITQPHPFKALINVKQMITTCKVDCTFLR